MNIVLNGTARELPDGMTMQQVLEELRIAPTRVACEVNLKIIKRAQYPNTRLCEGDTIEIVQMVAGG